MKRYIVFAALLVAASAGDSFSQEVIKCPNSLTAMVLPLPPVPPEAPAPPPAVTNVMKADMPAPPAPPAPPEVPKAPAAPFKNADI